MLNNYLGNASSIERLRSWVNSGASTSVILKGMKGLMLRNIADDLAKEILKAEKLATNPDYHVIEPDDKGKIGVEDASEIVRIASLSPVSGKHIIIIDSMDKMTVQGQNKLLKTIEDNENVVVLGIAYGDGILDTIKSRVLYLEFKPLTKDEFFEYYKGEEKELAYALSMGCPEGLTDEMVSYYKPIVESISLGEEKELLKHLSLYKEKDDKAFYSSRKNEALNLLNILEYSYMDVLRYIVLDEVGEICKPQAVYNKDQLTGKIELIEKEKSRIGGITYTKDDFFLFIVKLISI